MAENWLEERIEQVYRENKLTVAQAITKHFGDLDPTKAQTEIAELRAEVERLKSENQNLINEVCHQKREVARLQSELATEKINAHYFACDICKWKMGPFKTWEAATAANELHKEKCPLAIAPKWPVLREVGDISPAGNILATEYGSVPCTSFGYPLANRAWDFGPVPAFPPVEPSEPKPDVVRVRVKETGKAIWVFPFTDKTVPWKWISTDGMYYRSSEVEVLT